MFERESALVHPQGIHKYGWKFYPMRWSQKGQLRVVRNTYWYFPLCIWYSELRANALSKIIHQDCSPPNARLTEYFNVEHSHYFVLRHINR